MTAATAPSETFRHEALLYAGREEFLAGTLPFIRDSVRRREPIMVAVDLEKIALLQRALGADVDAVQFVDMGILGRNPARIIPAWLDFIDEHGPDRRVRGIGEPVRSGSSSAHLGECLLHESLLNDAFDGSPEWWLLCPYDTSSLADDIVDVARQTHPFVVRADGTAVKTRGGSDRLAATRLDAPLPESPRHAGVIAFQTRQLHLIRATVRQFAHRFDMDPDRTESLVVAVNEVATNSLKHGGGEGVLRVWREGDFMVCEVRDVGQIRDPLVGRRPPKVGDARGLWLVNRLCDLVQIRSYPHASVVRLHMAIAGQAEQRLTQLTLHDQLTGVGNRTMFRNRLEHALAVGLRDPRRHIVLFCDIDGFKSVNDTHGHRIGDEVLIAVAGRLREGARPGDTVARIGGDEFVVLCEGVAGDSDAMVIAERVATGLDSPIRTSEGAFHITVSIGVAMSRPGLTADDLLAEADTAMYAAKRSRQSTRGPAQLS